MAATVTTRPSTIFGFEKLTSLPGDITTATSTITTTTPVETEIAPCEHDHQVDPHTCGSPEPMEVDLTGTTVVDVSQFPGTVTTTTHGGKRKMPRPSALTTPSPIPKKKPAVDEEQEPLQFAEPVPRPSSQPSHEAIVESAQDYDSDFEAFFGSSVSGASINDDFEFIFASDEDVKEDFTTEGTNEPEVLSFDVQLDKGRPLPPSLEPALDDPSDNDIAPFVPDDSDSDDTLAMTFRDGGCFNSDRLTTPQPVYRSSEEVMAFLTAMVHFAVSTGCPWRGIGIVDPFVTERDDSIPTTLITQYMRGYVERPELVLLPIFASGGRNAVGHWYLVTVDTIQCCYTVYDALINPDMEAVTHNVDVDPHYRAKAALLCEWLQRDGYLARPPTYARFTPFAYNQQVDGRNCGVHVAKIAEQIAFLGFTHALYPWNIEDEANRMLQVCREIGHLRGLPTQWPPTCQSAAVHLPPDTAPPLPPATLAPPKPKRKKKKKGKKKAVASEAAEPVPPTTSPAPEPTLRRSKRQSVIELTKAVDRMVFDIEQVKHKADKPPVPAARLSADILPSPLDFGKMDKLCPHCDARLFHAETSNRCCACGTIEVSAFQPYPPGMEAILRDPEFLPHLRAYNTMMSMVTVAASIQQQMDIFVVSGEFKYYVGDILPQNGALPRFEQNYVFDADTAVTTRLNDATRWGIDPIKYSDRVTVDRLEAVLREHHPLAKKYKYAAELYTKQTAEKEARGEKIDRVYLIWAAREPTDGSHRGQYNAPSVQNTVFKLWSASDGTPVPKKCLMLSMDRSDGKKREIPFYSPQLDPAAYPLMFIYGEWGWYPGIPKRDPSALPATSSNGIQPNRSNPSTTSQRPPPVKRRPSTKRKSKKKDDDDTSSSYRNHKATQPVEPTTRVTRHSKPAASQARAAKSKQPKAPRMAMTQPIMSGNVSSTSQAPVSTTPAPADPPSATVSDADDEDDDESDDPDAARRHNPYVSMRGFHMSRMYDRTHREQFEFHPITGCRKLFQVYIMDVFTKVERQKLDKLEKIQLEHERRSERCKPLRETLQRLIDKDPTLQGKKLGSIVKLPQSYRSSPADMRNRYRNGVAINTRIGKGKSDLFVTFTGNPRWPEIEDNLRKEYEPPEKWTDRPDLVNRVFLLYAKEFLKDVLVNGILGTVKAYNYSVEHQKRGMPHIHMLIVLSKKDRRRLQTAQGIDDLISAELPALPEDDGTERTRRLRDYRIRVENMYIHHPGKCPQFCGMNKRNPLLCNKGYPKPFSTATIPNASGYAQLKRSPDGPYINGKLKGQRIRLTNQYVVPHNRYLVLKYFCHINIEDVRNVRSIKYIYKYQFKGHDKGFVRATAALGPSGDSNTVDYNEIEHYRNSHVVGASEVDMRLRTGLPVTKCSHVVHVLPVHLPAEHTVIFPGDVTPSQLADLTAEDGVDEGSTSVSKLTAFFKTVCEETPEFLHDPSRSPNLTYAAMPEHYTWNNKEKEWKRRLVYRKVIGRMDTIYPSNRERYCLRELLHHRKGPRSFEALRTVNGTVFPTFEAAAYELGYFVDDRLFKRTMEEAIAVCSPRQCRLTFALLVIFNRPKDPMELWNAVWRDLVNKTPILVPYEVRKQRALAHIASILYHHGMSMTDEGLPEVSEDDLMHAIANDYTDEEYDNDQDGSKAYAKLNTEQVRFVDRVTAAVDDPTLHRLFFLQGSGGTGKTFIYNTLIRRLRAAGKKVLAVASTGVAAILLHGGQTVHSAFRLPIDFDELRSVSAQNTRAVIAERADVIIWDEAPMQNHIIVRTVDALLRDWTGRPMIPFGGKVVIMGGDFKQILPVVAGGSIHDAYAASLLNCSLFTDNFAVYTLAHNMRAQKDPDYAAWLHAVGSGDDRTFDGRPGREGQIVLRLPEHIIERSKRKVIDFVYPAAIFDPTMPIEDYQRSVEKSAVVAPTNALVDIYNSLMIAMLPKKARHYPAKNWHYKTVHTEEDLLRPIIDTETMEVFEKPGFAVQNLVLKERTVVMLTRNLCIRSGLCNGTRMIVLQMLDEVISCRIITGPNTGSVVAIPKVEQVHDDAHDDAFPPFVRFQFPLRPAFAISINKSQGQTLSRVGIMLDTECFAHGQLYVALSRAGSSQDVKVYAPERDFVRQGSGWVVLAHNIVYRQVIQAVAQNMRQLFTQIM